MEISYKGRRGSPRRVHELRDVTFGVDLPYATFVASVPADYEGIPVIQWASAVLPDNPQPTADPSRPPPSRSKP
jgi:hypothetical protein